jgi:DNA-directed RNA polymerase subunit RPC12/RpoP
MSGNTLNGKCGDCEKVFVVVHLPMPLDKAAKQMKAAICPHCASTKIFVAA